MRFAVAVAPRSVLTTGIGTTGAGLTCTAVKDGNDWTLEVRPGWPVCRPYLAPV